MSASFPPQLPTQLAAGRRLPASREDLRRNQHRQLAVVLALVTSLAAYYVVPGPLLCLPALALFAVLAWRRLDLALAVLPLTFPFWYVPKAVYGHVVFPLSEIALGVCALVAAGQYSRRLAKSGLATAIPPVHPVHARLRTALTTLQRQSGAVSRLIVLGAALFVLGTGLGGALAVRPHEALRAFRWEVAEPLLYAALLLAYLRRRTALAVLVWSFLASGALVAALAIVQVHWLHVTFTPIADGNLLVRYADAQGNVPRATGIIYGSGNSLGAWLERIMPLALALGLMPLSDKHGRASGVTRGPRWVRRTGAWLVVALSVPALWESASRGAMLGAGVGCALVVGTFAIRRTARRAPHPVSIRASQTTSTNTSRSRRIRLCLAGLVGILVVVGLARWQGDAVLSALIQGHHGSGEMRLLLWLAALHMLHDHPLLGIGPDQFLYHYSSLYTAHPYWITRLHGHRTIAWREPTLSHPHNLVLDLWLSGGLLALVGFILVLNGYMKAMVQSIRLGTPWQAAVALGLLGALLASLVHGMVDSAYFEPDLALAFWMSVALLVLLRQSISGNDAQG